MTTHTDQLILGLLTYARQRVQRGRFGVFTAKLVLSTNSSSFGSRLNRHRENKSTQHIFSVNFQQSLHQQQHQQFHSPHRYTHR